MSSEKKTFRVPTDAYGGLQELAEDRDINEHKAGIRALERGLQEFGHGDFGEHEGWVGEMLAEIAKTLVAMGLAFGAATTLDPTPMLWFAAACLAGAALCLLGERHAGIVKAALGLPDKPFWLEDAGPGGDST